MREKLLERFKFKRIWFERSGNWIELWGDFNPKLILVRQKNDKNETVFSHELVKDGDIKGLELMNQKGTKKIAGRPKGTKKQVIVQNSAYRKLDDLKRNNPEGYQDALRELDDALKKHKDQDKIREILEKNLAKNNAFDVDEYLKQFPDADAAAKAIVNRGKLNSNLAKHVNKPHGYDIEAHHLIPVEVLSAPSEAGNIMRQAVKDGFDFNSFKNTNNGKFLKRYSSKHNYKDINTPAGKKKVLTSSPEGYHASHPKYTEEIERRLILYVSRGKVPKEAAEIVAKQMSKAINDLKSGDTLNKMFN